MHAKTIGLAFLLIVLLMAGCREGAVDAPEPSAEGPGRLADTGWRLTSLDGEAVEAAGKGGAPTLSLDGDRRAGGHGGCNRFGADYALDGDSLRFGDIVATKMACPAIGDLERRFFAALKATRSFRAEGDALVLLDAGGEPLARLEPAPQGGKTD